MSQDRHRQKSDAAKSDLERLQQQSEKILGPPPPDTAEDEDRIDVLGRRIGRAIGYLLGAYLLWHLLTTYVF
jgi:hypothetical protein